MTGKNRHIYKPVLCAIALIGLMLVITGCGIPLKHIAPLYDALQTSKEFRATYPGLTADIPYIENAVDLQKLDIYTANSEEPAPVFVFIHGGFWQSGHRKEYAALGKTFSKHGFVTVLVDYRLAPEVTYPVFSNDCADALNWIVNNIQNYGGDPNLIFLTGHSAGAQITADLVTNDSVKNLLAFDLEKLRGVVIFSGPFDYSTGKPSDVKIIRKVMQNEENFDRSQPIRYIRGDVPVMLIINGDEDRLTGQEQAATYAKAMEKAGAPVRYEAIPGGDHYSVVLDMVPGQEGPTLKVLLDFLNQRLADKK